MTSAKFENVRAPHDGWDDDQGFAQNDFGVRKFTLTTSSQAHALPEKWFRGAGGGQYLAVWSTVAGAQVAFSRRASGHEVDAAETATAAGASDGVGMPIPQEQWVEVLVPASSNGTVYFIREGTGAGDIYVRLAST